jgi:hypothetical protein
VIARNVNALLALFLLMSLPVMASGCKKKPKPFPPAPQLSTATTQGAPLGVGDAGNSSGIVTFTPSSLPTPADTLSPPDRAAFEQTKKSVAELTDLVKRGVTSNPDKPDEDATAKCATVEGALPRVEALTDPEAKALSTEAHRLCSLEVPILNADHALKQVTISPSQASRQLMCKYAKKDIDTARTAKPSDRRVANLDLRFTQSCR